MNELAEPAQQPQQELTHEYVDHMISSAMPDSDRKYLGSDDQPERVIDKPEKTQKSEKKKQPEIGDSEIPLDDEPEKVADEEGEEEEGDDEQPPDERTAAGKAKAATKWKMYREAYHEAPKLKSELETLKRQVAQLGDQTEVSTLRQHVQALAGERERLVRLVEQGNIESSEIWQNEVLAPLNQMWDDVQTIAQRNGMDATQLARLVQNRDDEVLNNYMDEHNTRPGDRHYLFGMIREVDKIERHKQYLRSHSHELSQRSQQQLLAQRDHYYQTLSSQRTSAVEAITPKIEQKILAVLPKDKRRNLQNDIKHILDFEKWEPDIQMYAGLSAVVLPDLLDSYNLLRSQLREAKAELVKFRGGGPKIITGGRTARAPAEEPEEETPANLAKVNLADFAEESTRRIRQGMGYRK